MLILSLARRIGVCFKGYHVPLFQIVFGHFGRGCLSTIMRVLSRRRRSEWPSIVVLNGSFDRKVTKRKRSSTSPYAAGVEGAGAANSAVGRFVFKCATAFDTAKL